MLVRTSDTKTRSTQDSIDSLELSLLHPVNELSEFLHSKLPTKGEVIGRVYHLYEPNSVQYSNFNEAIVEAAIVEAATDVPNH